MATHRLKSWAHFYDAIKAGRKLHDLRIMDREYAVGDILILERYDNINGVYSGENIKVEITYITSNKTPCAFSSSALDREYAILSIKLIQEEPFIFEDGEAKIENAHICRSGGGPIPEERLATIFTGNSDEEIFIPVHPELRYPFPVINDPRRRAL